MSLSPPETEFVPIEVFETTINHIEETLGFTNQPRVIVFHEKEGRRHAHCVWSCIDAQEMKAIDPSFDKLKLRDISREIYLEQGWKMPRGLMNSEERNPLNFTHAEWQQAKRQGGDPRIIKETLQECWAVSDSRAAFTSVLQERGYYLAKGDKRGHVVMDWQGDVYAVSRMVGIKSKEVNSKLGDSKDLLTVSETKSKIAETFTDRLRAYSDEIMQKHVLKTSSINLRKQQLTDKHRQIRIQLKEKQMLRQIAETKERSVRLPKGLKALWFRLTGKYKTIKNQIEAEAEVSQRHDRTEAQELINCQLIEKKQLQHEIRSMRFSHVLSLKKLNRDMAEFLRISPDEQENAVRGK